MKGHLNKKVALRYRKLKLMAAGIRCADNKTPSTRTSRHYFAGLGGSSICIVNLRTKCHGVCFLVVCNYLHVMNLFIHPLASGIFSFHVQFWLVFTLPLFVAIVVYMNATCFGLVGHLQVYKLVLYSYVWFCATKNKFVQMKMANWAETCIAYICLQRREDEHRNLQRDGKTIPKSRPAQCNGMLQYSIALIPSIRGI
jgi:hypothetical protein